jgi:hypothetical protein
MRNCWVEGSGYLIKRAVVDEFGPLREGESFSTYCTRAAAAGRVNGWYYLLYQEHMDDPHPNTAIRSDEDSGGNARQRWLVLVKSVRLDQTLKYSAWSLQACSSIPITSAEGGSAPQDQPLDRLYPAPASLTMSDFLIR